MQLETSQKLQELSKLLSRPQEELLAEAVNDYSAFQMRQIEKIKEGIRDADAGRFSSEEEMQKLFAKFGVE